MSDPIQAADLRRALRTYPAGAVPPDYEIVHAVPVRYELDGARGIRDPRGMVGQSLGIEFHMLGAASSAIRNLRSCIGRCHLEVESLVVSAYAAGLAKNSRRSRPRARQRLGTPCRLDHPCLPCRALLPRFPSSRPPSRADGCTCGVQ